MSVSGRIAGPLLLAGALAVAGCAAGTAGGRGDAGPAVLASGSVAGAAAAPPVPAPGGTRTARPVPPLPAGVDEGSASAVALAGVRALLSSDTARDADPAATVRRSAVWLTPGFAAEAAAAAPVRGPGAAWQAWAAHRARLVVRTRLGGDDVPPDGPAAAFRQVIATVTPVGRDRWRGPAAQRVLFVSLQRVDGGGWRIAAEREG